MVNFEQVNADWVCAVYQINPFHTTELFLYPMKTSQKGGSLFSGGLERGQ